MIAMPCVHLRIRCGECDLVNSRSAMPPVARVGEYESCFCGKCGRVTVGVIIERAPDMELSQHIIGARPQAPSLAATVLSAPTELED